MIALLVDRPSLGCEVPPVNHQTDFPVNECEGECRNTRSCRQMTSGAGREPSSLARVVIGHISRTLRIPSDTLRTQCKQTGLG